MRELWADDGGGFLHNVNKTKNWLVYKQQRWQKNRIEYWNVVKQKWMQAHSRKRPTLGLCSITVYNRRETCQRVDFAGPFMQWLICKQQKYAYSPNGCNSHLHWIAVCVVLMWFTWCVNCSFILVIWCEVTTVSNIIYNVLYWLLFLNKCKMKQTVSQTYGCVVHYDNNNILLCNWNKYNCTINAIQSFWGRNLGKYIENLVILPAALIETSYFKMPLSLKTTHSSCSHDQIKYLKDKADERKWWWISNKIF